MTCMLEEKEVPFIYLSLILPFILLRSKSLCLETKTRQFFVPETDLIGSLELHLAERQTTTLPANLLKTSKRNNAAINTDNNARNKL